MDHAVIPPGTPKSLMAIITAMLVSILLYGLVFGLLLKKPLSAGTIHDYFQIKTERAASLPSPKLVFFGGSNVRFGLSCALVERETGVPCVNAGFLADVGIDLMVQKFKPLLHPGDVIYIPLAYEQYLWSQDFVETQSDAGYLFTYDIGTLRQMPLSRQLHALFYYDIPYIASALAESLLSAGGMKRKAGDSRLFGAQNLNEWGDETGHTFEQAQDYSEVVARQKIKPPTVENFEPEKYFYTQTLENFLSWAHENDISVIGGLPQTADEFTIPRGVINKVRNIFESHQQFFIELPNHSQYPRTCFFDSLYHLTEECQLRHTRDLLPALTAWLPATPTRE